MEFSKIWQEASSQCLLPRLCFSGKSGKNKMAALASDWLRHFRLLLWNCERISTKLDRKQDLNALYQVCVFQVDRKNKMGALAYDLLRHFQPFLWNRWIEFNKTWQEARSQHPLPGLSFSGWSEKQDSRPVLWLAETFLTSPMKPPVFLKSASFVSFTDKNFKMSDRNLNLVSTNVRYKNPRCYT